MTTNVIALEEMTPSAFVAREIRVELARQERTQSWLAAQLGKNNTWVSARISRKNIRTVDLTVEEISEIAKALNVSAERLLFGWLPRLDSNQQPSGYTSAQVTDLTAYRIEREKVSA